MKKRALLLPLFALTAGAIFSGCSSSQSGPPDEPVGSVGEDEAGNGKAYAGAEDDLEEYETVTIADPLEPLNRATFVLNDGIYYVLLRPISKGYEFAVPEVARKGLTNLFDNVRFPVRFVNNTLQGNFKRAGQETGKFLVNSTMGVAGLWPAAERFPALADVPPADTGQTFAKWGIGHGFYLVVPVFGPSSARDLVGRAGDYGLNPVNWVGYWYTGKFFSDTYTWTAAIPATYVVSGLPDQVAIYDAATGEALDPYVALKAFYVQYRAEVAEQ